MSESKHTDEAVEISFCKWENDFLEDPLIAPQSRLDIYKAGWMASRSHLAATGQVIVDKSRVEELEAALERCEQLAECPLSDEKKLDMIYVVAQAALTKGANHGGT